MKVFWEIIGLIYELINRASQYGEFQPENVSNTTFPVTRAHDPCPNYAALNYVLCSRAFYNLITLFYAFTVKIEVVNIDKYGLNPDSTFKCVNT